jgi:hypothetical protein
LETVGAPLVEVRSGADAARQVHRTRRSPEVRKDKVERMRRLIAEGRLLTPERLDWTARCIMKELGL